MAFGGVIKDTYGKRALFINNKKGYGYIKQISFDFGVHLLFIDITFFNDYKFVIRNDLNPIHFIYCLKGQFQHAFGEGKSQRQASQYHSLIITSSEDTENQFIFKKDEKLEINFIQILRKKFLKKRSTDLSTLNAKLYEVFVDTDHKKSFRFMGRYNLELANKVETLQTIKARGMSKILKMEAMVYDILATHIHQHNLIEQGLLNVKPLLKSELKTIKKLADQIIKSPSYQYSLKEMSRNSGLSQAKLQDGFKHLYKRTVTDYIRHIRLEEARELLKYSDLNISQIVYSIGFTSRSYFSKIFKEKYDLTPLQFKKGVREHNAV